MAENGSGSRAVINDPNGVSPGRITQIWADHYRQLTGRVLGGAPVRRRSARRAPGAKETAPSADTINLRLTTDNLSTC
jgi:hypothetical protein